jgi:hypothetical protein
MRGSKSKVDSQRSILRLRHAEPGCRDARQVSQMGPILKPRVKEPRSRVSESSVRVREQQDQIVVSSSPGLTSPGGKAGT